MDFEFEDDLVKYHLRVLGVSSCLTVYIENEKELFDTIEAAQWIACTDSLGEPVTVNTDYIVAFQEAEE